MTLWLNFKTNSLMNLKSVFNIFTTRGVVPDLVKDYVLLLSLGKGCHPKYVPDFALKLLCPKILF